MVIESEKRPKDKKEDKIIKHFEDKPIEFIEIDNKVWITSKGIAKGLGINRESVSYIYKRHKEELEQYSSIVKLTTEAGVIREQRVYDETGFIGVCFLSGAENASPFRKWVLSVIYEVREKGFYIEKSVLNEYDLIVEMAIKLRDDHKQIEQNKENIELLGNKMDETIKSLNHKRKATPKTKKNLKEGYTWVKET